MADHRYWLGDDEGGFFDDSGGGDDGGDQFDDDDSSYNDDDDQQDGEDTGGGGDGGDGNGGDDGGNNGNDDDGNDDDIFPTADDFPNATEADFTDDDGSWSADDYQQSAANLFGDHEYFGDTLTSQLADEGYQAFSDPGFAQGFEEVAPGSSETVQLFERDGHLSAFGFVSMAMLQYLQMKYSGIDFSNLDVSVPPRGEPVQPRPLPPNYENVQPAEAVDLRKFCSPVGDQGQTARCSAFAWTHATELVNNMKGAPPERLSPSFTMLEFQRMQGDAQDYSYAFKGGDGTVSGTDPGQVLAEQGTCRQELWPDTSEVPTTSERVLIADAGKHRLEGTPHPIAIDDVRKVLSAGCPVHVAINTGSAFSQVGRDGIFNAAEAPSGRHGRHAMLIVGYTGNFFIVKNSWGESWGDKGYSYIPKSVLQESDPDLIAVLR